MPWFLLILVKFVVTFLPVCSDLPQTSVGVRAADGEGSGHDLRQLEGAHHVQHQAAQVKRNAPNAHQCYTLMHTQETVDLMMIQAAPTFIPHRPT